MWIIENLDVPSVIAILLVLVFWFSATMVPQGGQTEEEKVPGEGASIDSGSLPENLKEGL